MWRKIWLIMIGVVGLISGVGAFSALNFRLCVVDHAKLARPDMSPNAYQKLFFVICDDRVAGAPMRLVRV